MKLTAQRALQLLQKSKDNSLTRDDITELESMFPSITRGYDLSDADSLKELKEVLKGRANKMNSEMEKNLIKFVEAQNKK